MGADIALLGVVTATLASWLVQKVVEQDDANQAATQRQAAELTFRITALRTEFASQPAEVGAPKPMRRAAQTSWTRADRSRFFHDLAGSTGDFHIVAVYTTICVLDHRDPEGTQQFVVPPSTQLQCCSLCTKPNPLLPAAPHLLG